jgi:hypothetical protein
MNARLSEGNVVRTAKRILGLAGLASLVLVCPGLARAQSSAATASAPAAKPAAVTAPSTGMRTPSATSPRAVAQNSTAESPAPRGHDEGIKVHGHWMIEVKNPDGTVVTHREFENSIQQNGQLGIGALLAGRLTSGGLIIALNGNSITTTFPQFDIGNLPNVTISNVPTSSPCTWGFGGQAGPGPCLITSLPPGGGQQAFTIVLCGTAPSGSIVNTLGCSFNLTVAAPFVDSTAGAIFLAGLNTITLSGNVTAAASGTITDVETWGFGCLGGAEDCNGSNYTGATVAPQQLFYTLTERTLDGVGGDPNSVPVTGGQSIAATVTLSFQ